MINTKNCMQYGYNDICIEPARISFIGSRSECNTLKNGVLPIFTAPMSTVVNLENYKIFKDNQIIPIIPRNIPLDERIKTIENGDWTALSLSEFEDFIKGTNPDDKVRRICIDVANGNMNEIFHLSEIAKSKFGKNNIILMSGNIANPRTYLEYCKAGIDYVRLSIGTGSGCLSASNCGIFMGIVNLLENISVYKEDVEYIIQQQKELSPYKCVTKVIADGGIRNYSDVIKALALGADYVMIGGLLAQLVESAAKTYYYDKNNNIHILDPLGKDSIKEQNGYFDVNEEYLLTDVYKVFYGMASKRGQEDLFGEKKRTAEGLVKNIKCTTNINKWSKNMSDYLASAMSYCGIEDINDFNDENVETYVMSQSLQNSINK